MNWLEKSSTAAVTILAVLGSVELGFRLHARWTGTGDVPAAAARGVPTARPQRPPSYTKGERLPAIEGLPSLSRPTLLVVVRSGCRYCDASMDFYKRLLSSPNKQSVLFVSYEPVERTAQYLAGHGIENAKVASVQAEAPSGREA
jgi:hypothetical protein